MKRLLLKTALAFAVLGAVSVAVAPFAVKRLLPPEKIRALVVSGAQKNLNRQVTLGDISFSLLSGLSLKDLKISEVPTFEAGTFASMEAFNVNVRWLPLLKRKVVIDTVSAQGLAVRVVKKEDGRFNFSDLSGGPAAGAAAPAGGAPAAEVELAVRGAKISRGKIVYEEAGGRRAVTISELDADVGGFSLSGLFSARLSARAAGHWDGRKIDGSAAFSGRVDLGGKDPGKLRAEIKSLEVSTSGWRLRASGSARDMAKPDLDLEVAVDAPGGPLGTAQFKGVLVPPAESKALNVEGTLKIETKEIKAADAAALGLPAGMSVMPLKAAAGLSYSGDAARFKSLEIESSIGTARASGQVSGLESGKPSADVEIELKLDVPALKATDVPWAKLPAGFVSPALAIEGKAKVKGDDLALSGVKARTAAGTVEVSGTVRKLTSGSPQPELDIAAKLSLPALKSADIPSSAVPPDLSLPASQWDGSLSVSRDEVAIRSLRMILGKNDVQIENGRLTALRSDNPLVNITVKCRSFQLDELTQISPATRELGLTGSGFFALGVSGRMPRPVLEGKLQFKDIGAVVSGLKLAGFTGTASFNERRIDVPNLRGAVADGRLEMNLTVKNYSKEPDVDLEASLSEFDMAAFMKAKASVTTAKPAAPASEAQADAKAKPPMSARGKLAVGVLKHSGSQARDMKLTWDLEGMTPDLKRLGGWAKLYSSGGRISSLGEMATQSKVVKVLVFPLMIFQKIGRLGGIKLFPDFNNVEFSELAGDYAFSSGVMTLRDSHLYSEAGNVNAAGSIDLHAEKLNLTVTAQVARMTPIDVDVRGSFEQPKTNIKVGKLLADPAKKLLDSLFKK